MDDFNSWEKKQRNKHLKEGIKPMLYTIFAVIVTFSLLGELTKKKASVEVSGLGLKNSDSTNYHQNVHEEEIRESDGINELCRTDKKACTNQWFDRIVKVEFEVNFVRVHSTGFIYYSDEDYIYVISNSHSIRIGDGKNSLIHDISVYSDYYEFSEKPISACAFFKSYADISLIKIPNVTRFLFDKPKLTKNVKLNEKLNVYTNRDEKLLFKPVLKFFNEAKPEYFMSMEALGGMSGSPVFNSKFELAGVLHSSSAYGAIATYNIGFLETDTIDDLIAGDNYNSKFICRTNF